MTADVRVERRGALGLLTLDRPAAINALTHDMVVAVSEALAAWADDPGVQTVVISGAGERGLCAGGDIVALYDAARSGEHTGAARFWADEYRMNALLARYPKPVVALQDGIVLGGGIGISAHCSHRIVTERSRLGLPEVGIGFVPDVGATWLLSRSPGELGTAAGLTARHAGAGDAIALGLSDVFVPSDRLPALLFALEDQEPDAAIAAVAEPPPSSDLAASRSLIDELFAGDDLARIVARLDAAGERGEPFLTAIRRASPTATAVTLAALRRARDLPGLDAALVQEYRISLHALGTHDFAEGVRAQVIDKDRSPRWSPAALADIDRQDVDAYFSIPDGGDLDLEPNLASKEQH
jgi:enoyl-CoA hydratase